MKAMLADGGTVIKPDDMNVDDKNRQPDPLSLFRVWSLLTGEDQMRHPTTANRAVR
jgi:hypothetical protein